MYKEVELYFKSQNNIEDSFLSFKLAADWDGYELSVSWKQGFNIWFIPCKVNRMFLLNEPDKIFEIIDNLIKLRDTKVRDIKFWTNCSPREKHG
jgi:hypothetical protein